MPRGPLAVKARRRRLALSTNGSGPANRRGMIESTLPGGQCRTMPEVRAGVDQTDRDLVHLPEPRFGYMRAAARIKQDRATVRDEVRKAAVIAAAAERAAQAGLPRA